MQPHRAGEILSTLGRDCSHLGVPGKAMFMGAEVVIKYSLLL